MSALGYFIAGLIIGGLLYIVYDKIKNPSNYKNGTDH